MATFYISRKDLANAVKRSQVYVTRQIKLGRLGPLGGESFHPTSKKINVESQYVKAFIKDCQIEDKHKGIKISTPNFLNVKKEEEIEEVESEVKTQYKNKLNKLNAVGSGIGNTINVAAGGHIVNEENLQPEVVAVLDMTLRNIITRHGSVSVFKEWLKAHETVLKINKLEREKQEEEGELVSREFVSQTVFGYVDGIQRRILSDCPRTITGRVFEAVKASKKREDVIQIVENVLSTAIREIKKETVKRIKNA